MKVSKRLKHFINHHHRQALLARLYGQVIGHLKPPCREFDVEQKSASYMLPSCTRIEDAFKNYVLYGRQMHVTLYLVKNIFVTILSEINEYIQKNFTEGQSVLYLRFKIVKV